MFPFGPVQIQHYIWIEAIFDFLYNFPQLKWSNVQQRHHLKVHNCKSVFVRMLMCFYCRVLYFTVGGEETVLFTQIRRYLGVPDCSEQSDVMAGTLLGILFLSVSRGYARTCSSAATGFVKYFCCLIFARIRYANRCL